MLPSPRVELTFVALVSSRMEVIVVFAGDMVVAVVAGLLVTKEPEVDAEFVYHQSEQHNHTCGFWRRRTYLFGADKPFFLTAPNIMPLVILFVPKLKTIL